jgi:hypothetical protein
MCRNTMVNQDLTFKSLSEVTGGHERSKRVFVENCILDQDLNLNNYEMPSNVIQQTCVLLVNLRYYS